MFAHVTHIHKLSLKCEQQLKEKDLSLTIRLVSCKKSHETSLEDQRTRKCAKNV